jgi:hypothetical protein
MTDDRKVSKVLSIVFADGKAVVESTIGDLLEELRENIVHMGLREPFETRFSIGIAGMIAMWQNEDGYSQFGATAYNLMKVIREIDDLNEGEEHDYLFDALENLMQIVVIASIGAYNELG